MKPLTARVIYDKPVYHSGDVLNGVLCVYIHKALAIDEINLKIVGKCKVEWTESSSANVYNNSEKYVDHSCVLFKPVQLEAMEPGEYKYPFTIVLPSPLPETFESTTGKIVYYCKGSIKAYSGLASCVKNVAMHKEKAPFMVHAKLPVGFIGAPSINITEELPWACICCICIKRGKLTTSLNLNKKGYVPGEDITINAKINNDTSRAMNFFQATVNQKIIYISTMDKRRYESNDGICTTNSSNTLPPHSVFLWRDAVLKLPNPLPATNLGGCRIIKIEYTLEVNVGENSSCCSPNARYEVPIIIGSS